MKLIKFITILLISAGSLTSYAQTSANAAHTAAHKQLLAKAKSSQIDKTVIKDILEKDIERKEDHRNSLQTMSAQTSSLINDLLSEANSHMGKRYRSGAKGPSAFDCSGFSSYVFRQFGYQLSPSSGAQFSQGNPVDKKNLRKGDLVFFTGRNNKRGRVGHVGIVVSADNEKGTFRFIHASTSGGIKIDTNDGYYGSRYLGARRVINDGDL